MTKTEQILKQTCQNCCSTFQLMEIHEEKRPACPHCLLIWKEKLHQYYQQQIILHLAQKDQKEDHE